MATRLRFFFDYKSPFAYLALGRIFRIEKEFNVDVEWLPFAFDVKSGFGAPEERTLYQKTKIKYWYLDARRYANEQGIKVYAPKRVFDSTLSHMGALWAQKQSHSIFIKYTSIVYEKFFQRNLELDDKLEIKNLLVSLGVSLDGFDEFICQEGQDRLCNIQDIAKNANVFGVPSILFEDGEVFFGQDRLQMVENKLVEGRLANDLYFSRKRLDLQKDLKHLDTLQPAKL